MDCLISRIYTCEKMMKKATGVVGNTRSDTSNTLHVDDMELDNEVSIVLQHFKPKPDFLLHDAKNRQGNVINSTAARRRPRRQNQQQAQGQEQRSHNNTVSVTSIMYKDKAIQLSCILSKQ